MGGQVGNIISFVSMIVGLISVMIVIAINYITLKKMRRESAMEKVKEKVMILDSHLEQSIFGQKVLASLNNIEKSQGIYSEALLHMLRRDLLNFIDDILYINRKKNTKGSKWSNLEVRLERYSILEEVMDNCYKSYSLLGGNHYIEEMYHEAKTVIKETRRQTEF